MFVFLTFLHNPWRFCVAIKRPDKPQISLVTNQDFLPVVMSLLTRARKSIDILSFSFTSFGAAKAIAEKLKEIKIEQKKMIQIRFFSEGIRETYERNKVTADFLSESGIEVHFGATHAKGFCIDGRYVLFGSTNLTNQSIMKNHEANLLIDDRKIAHEFKRYFEHLWHGGQHGEIELKAPLLADGAFKDVLVDVINRSKKLIEFSIYFFSHKDIEKALIAAHQRGVRIVGFIHQHKSFALSYIRMNRATVKRLQTAGIEELHWGKTSHFSHSKYLVADRKEFLLGTGNWLLQDVEIHPQLYIHLTDSVVAKKLGKHLLFQIESSMLN
jgi:hypothetical protein